MLKKSVHIILSFLLLVATSGLFLSKHYCGGKLLSVSLFQTASSCCDSDSCCQHETAIIQLDWDCSVVAVLTLPQAVQMDLLDASLVAHWAETALYELVHQRFIPTPLPPGQFTLFAVRQSFLL